MGLNSIRPISLRALTFFGDVHGLCEDARERLTKAAAAVDLDRLSKLTAQRGLAREGMSR